MFWSTTSGCCSRRQCKQNNYGYHESTKFIKTKNGDHMFNLGDIIDIGVRLEQNAEKVYTKAVKENPVPLLRTMFTKLASDEIEHQKWFESLRDQIKPTDIDPALEEMGKTMLQDIVGEQAFSITELDLTKIESVKALLEAAIEFENDTIIFYEMIAGFITDEHAAKGLQKIIDEETRHVSVLTESFESGI
jgi:rubrerythrin